MLIFYFHVQVETQGVNYIEKFGEPCETMRNYAKLCETVMILDKIF